MADHAITAYLRHYLSTGLSTPVVGVGDTAQEQPLGIKTMGEGYQSDAAAAQFAGKRALFLSDLEKEEKCP